MELFPIKHINPLEIFPSLREIPDPPTEMTARGDIAHINRTLMVAICLPESPSEYGIAACEKLIRELASFPFTVICPLHPEIIECCMSFRNKTIAVCSSVQWGDIDEPLARRFLVSGGTIISSEHAPIAQTIGKLADIAVVIEAKENEQELAIAKATNRYKKMVCAVPGPVTAGTSFGSNRMLSLGAIPVTCAKDIITEFMYLHSVHDHAIPLNEQEVLIVDALGTPKTKLQLMEELGLTEWHVTILCSSLESKGIIKEQQGEIHLV